MSSRRSVRTLPSVITCFPSTEAVRRRSSRTGVESRRWTRTQEVAGEHGGAGGDRFADRVQAERVDPPAGEGGEAAPGGGQPEVGVEAAAEELEVVGGGDEAAEEDQRQQGGGDEEDPGDADRQRPAEAADGESDQAAVGEPGPQRPAVELVERVGADADREEEGGDRRRQPAGVDLRRRRGPDRDVADVPERVGRVQDRDQVPPAAGAQGVEGGAGAGISRQRCPR